MNQPAPRPARPAADAAPPAAPAAALRAFHTSRANAARTALRHADAAADEAAGRAWAAVLDAHRQAAVSGDQADSDRAERMHRDANHNHPA